MLEAAKRWARRLKSESQALLIAGRDPGTPFAAKAVALAVALYALSPIDLIPDFIPVLGYLDDLLIVPLGIMLAVKLVPPELMDGFRRRAVAGEAQGSRIGAAIVIGLWLAGGAALAWWAAARFG